MKSGKSDEAATSSDFHLAIYPNQVLQFWDNVVV